jgi:hypothetical protein
MRHFFANLLTFDPQYKKKVLLAYLVIGLPFLPIGFLITWVVSGKLRKEEAIIGSLAYTVLTAVILLIVWLFK